MFHRYNQKFNPSKSSFKCNQKSTHSIELQYGKDNYIKTHISIKALAIFGFAI